MKANLEQIRSEFRTKLKELESRGTPIELTKSRRFFCDKWHPYGWQIGFRTTMQFPDGTRARRSLADIGTDRAAAISNALRDLRGDCVYFAHPEAELLYNRIKQLEATENGNS